MHFYLKMEGSKGLYLVTAAVLLYFQYHPWGALENDPQTCSSWIQKLSKNIYLSDFNFAHFNLLFPFLTSLISPFTCFYLLHQFSVKMSQRNVWDFWHQSKLQVPGKDWLFLVYTDQGSSLISTKALRASMSALFLQFYALMSGWWRPPTPSSSR